MRFNTFWGSGETNAFSERFLLSMCCFSKVSVLNKTQSMHKVKHMQLQNLISYCCLHLSLSILLYVSLFWFLPFFCWGGVTTCMDCLFGVTIETHVSVWLFVCSCPCVCVFVLVWWDCSSASCIMTSTRHRPRNIKSVCFLGLCNG